MSSTQGFRNIIQLPLTFLNIQASSFIPDENKLFWQFHHNENSNSIMLASVHHWISKACIYFSILLIDKTFRSYHIYVLVLYFRVGTFVLTSILPYPIKKI